jgi:O-antigen/teichoic acid export membrane protein
MTAQVAAAVSVAGAGLGPIAVGVTVSAGSIVGNVVISLALSRRLERGAKDRFSRRLLMRRSLPLGLASVMTRIYLTIDLVLLGWLVSGPRLGQYAAASKVVTVLAGLAGTVMSGALPTLAAKATQSGELEDLAARIWHWLVVGALPLFVALALFARPLVTVALGHQYVGAAPLLRILALAGAIGVLSNLVGNLMIVFGRNRAMLAQNGVAIVFNIVGNLILIPRFGVTAAAWLTVATEALVCLGAVSSIRSQVSFAAVRRVSGRPVIAMSAASVVALVLHRAPVVAAPAAATTFLLLISALRAWPAEFRVRRWAAGG